MEQQLGGKTRTFYERSRGAAIDESQFRARRRRRLRGEGDALSRSRFPEKVRHCETPAPRMQPAEHCGFRYPRLLPLERSRCFNELAGGQGCLTNRLEHYECEEDYPTEKVRSEVLNQCGVRPERSAEPQPRSARMLGRFQHFGS